MGGVALFGMRKPAAEPVQEKKPVEEPVETTKP